MIKLRVNVDERAEETYFEMTQRNGMPRRRKAAPDQAQLRIDPETGKSYIYVEKPERVVIAEMDADVFAAFKAKILATQPTEEEIRTGIWADERPQVA